MKIGIESSVLIRNKKTGIDYYTQELIKSTAKIMPKDIFYICYLSFLTKEPIAAELKSRNIFYRRNYFFPGKAYNFLYRYLYAPAYDMLFGLKFDVVIYPNFVRFPLLKTKKSVLFIHDTAYLDSPENLIERHRKFLKKFVPYSIIKASQVITISENTKKQLIRHYRVDPNKINVVNPAVDHNKYFPAEKIDILRVKNKYGIKKKYILFLGTIEPRKNIEGLLEAYAELDEKIKSKYELVLAGGKGWLDDSINDAIIRLGDRVIRTGYIDDKDKPALYSGASLFVYPSHYEGWGMQILEAMACGTPVIASDNSSLPEVVGKAGIMINSRDYIGLASNITQVLLNKRLAKKMSRNGLLHSKKFSWEISARKLKIVLDKL